MHGACVILIMRTDGAFAEQGKDHTMLYIIRARATDRTYRFWNADTATWSPNVLDRSYFNETQRWTMDLPTFAGETNEVEWVMVH
jgi:hypothetical protein